MHIFFHNLVKEVLLVKKYKKYEVALNFPFNYLYKFLLVTQCRVFSCADIGIFNGFILPPVVV